MKNIATLLLILTTTLAFGQNESSTSKRGLEMQVNTGFSFITLEQNMSVRLTDSEGDSFWHGYDREYKEVGITADFQFGYRFNKKWSAGIYAGAALYYEGFFYFLPQFGASVDAGVYGTYHFNDYFSLAAVVGSRIPPIGAFTGSFSLSPELALGKQKQIKLRYSVEVFYGKRNVRYYHSHYEYDYDNPPATWTGNEVEVFEGNAPETTLGFQHEIGLAFTWGK